MMKSQQFLDRGAARQGTRSGKLGAKMMLQGVGELIPGMLSSVSTTLPSLPPPLGIPNQSWKTTYKTQTTKKQSMENTASSRGTTRTPGGTISTGNRAPTTAERFDNFKMEFWPWIIVALVSGCMGFMAQSTLPILAALSVEGLFWLYCLLQHRFLNQIMQPEPITRDVVELWRMCLTNVPCTREFLKGWFYDVPFESITRDDVKDFLAWALFSTTFPLLAAQDVRTLVKVFHLVEHHCNTRFKRRSAHVEPLASMRFSIEPVEYHHKPLLFYAATKGLLGGLGDINLIDAGFSKHNAGALNYWIRMPTSAAARTKLPIVFVHGVGVGLVTYMGFVRKLTRNDCPIMCVELPFVSMSIDARVPSINQQLASVTSMLDTWGFDKAAFVGHSYGSILLSWMVQHEPERVASVAFIDPVVIMLNLKSTLYNFLYRHSTNGKISDLVGTELFLNHALRRHFWWYRNIIWAQDMHQAGIPSLVIVSENDEIVPSADVAKHINTFEEKMQGNSLVRCHVIEDGSHGQMLFDEELQEDVCTRISAHWSEANEASSRIADLKTQKRMRGWSSIVPPLKFPGFGVFKRKVQSKLAAQFYKQTTQVGMQLAVGARWKTRTLSRPVQKTFTAVFSDRLAALSDDKGWETRDP